MKTLITLIVVLQLTFSMAYGQTTYLGTGAGTLGDASSYFGYYACNAATISSAWNSFMGAYSGRITTSGNYNTGIGHRSLSEQNDEYNVAFGADALPNLHSGQQIVAVGRQALHSLEHDDVNPDGTFPANTVYGYKAAYSYSDGNRNVAVGSVALEKATVAIYSTAAGFGALQNHDSPDANTATGAYASQQTTGNRTAAFGSYSLNLNGHNNSAFGFEALHRADPVGCSISNNTAFGAYAGLGKSANCNLENTTAIGYSSLVTSSNQIRLGNASVTSIGGQVSWSTLSDGRFKKDLQNDIVGLEFIDRLNPVSYSLDKSAFEKFLGTQDGSEFKSITSRTIQNRQVGFVAQEVEASLKKSRLAHSLVTIPKQDGDPYTLQYAEFVVPLVQAVQELSDQADASQKEIAALEESLSLYETNALANNYEKVNENFSRETGINTTIPETSTSVSVVVYNTEGKQLKVISLSQRGTTSLSISHSDLPAGKYYYAIIADEMIVEAKRFIVL
jgi:trimeric autotransporter adhesin